MKIRNIALAAHNCDSDFTIFYTTEEGTYGGINLSRELLEFLYLSIDKKLHHTKKKRCKNCKREHWDEELCKACRIYICRPHYDRKRRKFWRPK